MKNVEKIILFTAIALGLLACENSVLESESSIIEGVAANPRIIVSESVGVESKSNPNLYGIESNGANGKWEKVDRIYLNGGSSWVDPPWVEKEGNSMNIPKSIRTDIKYSDGWFLLGHTMKDQLNDEPDYILFYHKQGGILKVFYYHKGDPSSNLTWVLSSDSPSSMIPSNLKVANISTQADKYATTSNLINPNYETESLPLVYGWNCFSFELPYGVVNVENPNISISGSTTLRLTGGMKGSLNGQVIIPGSSRFNTLDDWTSYFGMLNNFNTAANSLMDFFPKKAPKKSVVSLEEPSPRILGSITAGLSVASSILGGVSFFTSKTRKVTQRFNFSGDIKLTGEFEAEPNPIVRSINDFSITKLNNNQILGVWGLQTTPRVELLKYTYVRTPPASMGGSLEDISVGRTVNFKPHFDVIINPSLSPNIKKYTTSVSSIYCARDKSEQLEFFSYKEMNSSKWTCAEISNHSYDIDLSISPDSYPLPSGYRKRNFYIGCGKFPSKAVANIEIEIEYKDGSCYKSSRPFEVIFEIIDNSQEIMQRDRSNWEYSIFLD